MFQKVANEHLIPALALEEKAKTEGVEEAPSQSVDGVKCEDSLVG